MAYKENQTIEVEFQDLKVSVQCDVDWAGKPSNSDVFIDSINALPQFYFEKSFIYNIERAVLDHLYKDEQSELEFQAEAIGDELRGN